MYQRLDKEILLELFKKDFSKPKEASQIFYKGISSNEPLHDLFLCNPALNKRESKTVKENGNTYNLLLNNLPSWHHLPKRENSIIFSSNKKTAAEFSKPRIAESENTGKLYCVIPSNNSLIVIAPCSDILFSFRKALGILGIRGFDTSLIILNNCLKELLSASGYQEAYDDSWKQLTGTFEKIESEAIKPMKSMTVKTAVLYKKIMESKSGILNYFNEIFSPDYNGFSSIIFGLQTLGNDANVEAWTNANCLLINFDVYKELF